MVIQYKESLIKYLRNGLWCGREEKEMLNKEIKYESIAIKTANQRSNKTSIDFKNVE